MDLMEVKKPNDCDEDCECTDCEMRTANDDDSISVSVSPRRFELPKSTDKKAKMKIKNENEYPIYFRARTSNMNVFRPLPDNGQIAPNSKACLDVQFYDSAMPLRRHEEVIVFTSVKPFDQPPMYKERICPYCMQSFDISKHHVRKQHSHTDECLPNSDLKINKENVKLSRYAAQGYEENKVSHHDDFELKSKTPKQKRNTAYDLKSQENNETKKVPEEYEKEIPQQTKDYIQKNPKNPNFEEYKKGFHRVVKIKPTNGSHDLQEVCIHALVRVPSASGCECTNCVELWTGKEHRERLEASVTPEKQNDDRSVKSDESISEDKLYRTEKDTYAPHGKIDVKHKRKSNGIKAHILARILSTEDVKELLSDANLLESSSSDILPRRSKIISEEDYKEKKEKLKKKPLMRYGEESEDTTKTDDKDQQKGSDEKSIDIEQKSPMEVLVGKLNTLKRLSWANLFLVLLLIVTVVGGFTYCCRSGHPEKVPLPCLDDIKKYFE